MADVRVTVYFQVEDNVAIKVAAIMVPEERVDDPHLFSSIATHIAAEAGVAEDQIGAAQGGYGGNDSSLGGWPSMRRKAGPRPGSKADDDSRSWG
jgi:hypothetical protein